LTFTDISFIDNNSGLAISVSLQGTGGGIMKTTDGGRNWQFTTYRYVNSTNTVQLASFNDVHYVTPTIAYAVASSGIMIKSTDGGSNWSQVVTPLTALSKTINGLHFINKDTGYIAGAAINTTNTTNINDAPKIYITRNGGISWDSLVTPFVRQETNASLNWNNNKEIYRLHFVNDSVGYASGTSGLLWKIEKNVITDYSLHRSKFGLATGSHTPSTSGYRGLLGINDSVVLMGSQNNSTVVRVKTGKNDSTASAAPAIYGDYVRGTYSVVVWLAGTSTPYPAPMAGNIGSSTVWHFRKGPDGKIWMIVGPNVCWSVDNGTNWGYSRLHPPSAAYQNNWPAQGLEVTPNGRIIVGFYNGLLYDSLPGSPAWQTAYSNLKPGTELGPYHYTNIDWADYCNGVVVGNAGTILKTSDGGKTWINNSDPTWDQTNVTPGISIPIVKYPAPDKMFYLGGTTLYRSPDQGITRTGLFAEPSGNAAVNNLELVGDRAFVIAYRFSGIQRAFIYRINNVNTGPTTVDIYNNFVTGATGSLAPQLRNIKFANADTGYTCGSRGKVYRTIDGGNTWTDISPDTLVNNNGSANYTALSVVNGRTIYIGGNTRKFFRSTDAGLTWTDMTFPVIGQTPFTNNTSILQILMNDPNNGYAVSSGNLLLKTTDGWNTWTYDLSPVTFQNIALYPKDNSVPFNSKKLYQIGFQNGTQPNSSNTAHLLEYGNFTLTDLKTTETTVGSSCTNPTAGSITVTATGGILPYSYSINGGAFQSSNAFTGLTQGAKTITIKDAGCAVITKTITVPFTDNLTLTTNNDTTVCAGAPVQMLATSQATTYSWTPSCRIKQCSYQ
jgi:photosystem II stability/assembly factor-like uncharacterized protein